MIFLHLALLMFSQPLYALDQNFNVSRDKAILASISSKELSRLVFDSRIIRVFGISGEFHHEILDNSLYLKPHTTKPINFFVFVESGDTYKIIAVQEDVPATEITIHRVGNDDVPNGVEERSRSREVVFKNTLKAPGTLYGEETLQANIRRVVQCIMSDEILDYKVTNIDRSYRKKDGIRKTLDSIWKKSEIEAKKYYLTNVSSESLTLNKEDYLDDANASYLNRDTLAPLETAILITIRVGS
jgi:hypothetical protein